MKKRKVYEKPAMQVYELEDTARILMASARGGYDPNDSNPFVTNP